MIEWFYIDGFSPRV